MNLNEEIRNGYRISSTMKEVWNLQLQMLRLLLDVCGRNNLSIWADSGTLLGCVRHKGYIPWDDDIDMIMFRDDYEKLLQVAKHEVKSPFFLQASKTEKHPYPIGHAQLRMGGTAAILPSAKRYRYHQGIFIDIFVLDSIPPNRKDIRTFSEAIEKKKKKFIEDCVPLNLTTHISTFIAKLLRRIQWKRDYYAFEQEIKRYNSVPETRVANISLTHDVRRMEEKSFPVEWYEGTVMLQFEDMLMPCPSHYDEILKALYGEYMTPVQAPTMHGGYEVLDTKKSYKSYLMQYRKEYYKGAITRFFNK